MPYMVRRSDRAQRVRISVIGDGTVEVVLPHRVPARHAEEAVRQLGPWIARRRATVLAALREQERAPGTVPYLGRVLTLRAEPGRTRVNLGADDVLSVPAGPGSTAAIERWMRRRAREVIAPKLDAATARAGTRYRGLTIRGQRTRWASCSSTGAMSFNWRLMLAPEPVLDYVVEHEVAHLQVMDHSPRFWKLVEARVPDWREHAGWLRRYGQTLVL